MHKYLVAAVLAIVGLVAGFVLPEKAKGPQKEGFTPPGQEVRQEKVPSSVSAPGRSLPESAATLPPPAASAHLAKAGELTEERARKNSPKIASIAPPGAALESPLTITGSGFTLVGNRIMVRGRIVLADLISPDGKTLALALPQNTPCDIGQACPIKVVNANGISNARPIKLTALVDLPEPSPFPTPSTTPELPQTPPPTPVPTPTLTPVPATPVIFSLSPSIGSVGAIVTIYGSGFTKTGNSINFGGTQSAVTGLASDDGTTLVFTVPQVDTCKPVNACAVSVSNTNGMSNSVSFTLTQAIVPVNVLLPNGGEEFVPGLFNTVRWSGGKDVVHLALVADSAIHTADPTDLIFGWLKTDALPNGSYLWEAKQACSPDMALCWPVPAGSYKMLAVSENELGVVEIWDHTVGKPGNFDVSDAPFRVLAAPKLTVISPNGGESFKRGTVATVGWEAVNIVSRQVNVELLKAGVFSRAIAANVSLDVASGLFTYAWPIPSDLATGSDYTLEVSDAANTSLRDTSDAPFSVVSNETVTVLSPNGGETWVRGFEGPVFWKASKPNAVTANLLKGGVFLRTLKTGIKPAGFSGFTLMNLYPGAYYVLVPVTLDLAEGDDYTLELVDEVDGTIRDKSDTPFRVITLPSPVTFKGRLIDAFSSAALPNVGFGGYSGNTNMDGTSYSVTLPRFTSDSNGAFSLTATTSDLVTITRNKALFAGWPQCNDAAATAIVRYPDIPRVPGFGGWYSNLYPLSSVRQQYFPLASSMIDFGDIPSWPTARYIMTFTDVPSIFWVRYYRDDGSRYGFGLGNVNYTLMHILSNAVPLDVDTRVEFTDKAGVSYLSPSIRLARDARCTIPVLSFMDGIYKWEPYVVGFWLSANPFSLTVGTAYTGTLTPYTSPYYYGTGNQGVAPFTWGWVYGSLPPGLTFDAASGIISGTPTTAGTYKFGVRVKDANGVRASQDLSITVK